MNTLSSPPNPVQPGAGTHPSGEPDLRFWLGHLALANPRILDGLGWSPVVLPAGLGRRYLLAHEAVGKRLFEVLEQGGGVVQEAVASNLGVEPVLVPEGSSLKGAKQNRVVVETVLVGPGQTVPINVGCVEQGCWHFISRKFDLAPEHVEPILRRRTVRETAMSGHVDQHRLWAEVAECSAARGCASPTHDYYEAVAEERRRAEEHARAVETFPGQVGIIGRAGGRLLGFEVFGHPESWSALHAGLVPSYLLSAGLAARAAHEGQGEPERTAAEWLAAVASSSVRARPSHGLGLELALNGPGLAGAGLWVEGHAAHLAVFGE